MRKAEPTSKTLGRAVELTPSRTAVILPVSVSNSTVAGPAGREGRSTLREVTAEMAMFRGGRKGREGKRDVVEKGPTLSSTKAKTNPLRSYPPSLLPFFELDFISIWKRAYIVLQGSSPKK